MFYIKEWDWRYSNIHGVSCCSISFLQSNHDELDHFIHLNHCQQRIGAMGMTVSFSFFTLFHCQLCRSYPSLCHPLPISSLLLNVFDASWAPQQIVGSFLQQAIPPALHPELRGKYRMACLYSSFMPLRDFSSIAGFLCPIVMAQSHKDSPEDLACSLFFLFSLIIFPPICS